MAASEHKNTPILDALFFYLRGYTSRYMEEIFPEENAQKGAAWDNLATLIEQYFPDMETSEKLTDAIFDYTHEGELLAFSNGIRFATRIMSELHRL